MRKLLTGMIAGAMVVAPTLAQAAPNARPAGQIGVRSSFVAQDDLGSSSVSRRPAGTWFIAGLAFITITLGIIIAVSHDDSDADGGPVSS